MNAIDSLVASSQQPFSATPDSRLYFAHSSIESARQTVVRAILRSEGPAVVLGGAGYGKTMLAQVIEQQMCERMDVVLLQSARLSSRRALLQSILFELRMPYRDLSEGELRLSILDRLEPSPETAPEGLLIIVDEAHTLHWKLLDELRLISNFVRNHSPRVKLVAIGNMRLEELLTTPQLESFNQRLAARCYLQPMSRAETFEYIQFQFKCCGFECSTLITQDACQAIYTASQGIPRLVNQLASHALWLAHNNAQNPVSVALINEAWRDLQQLPTPWTGDLSESKVALNNVEFGELSDNLDEEESFATVMQESTASNVNSISVSVSEASVQPAVIGHSQPSAAPTEYRVAQADEPYFAAFSSAPSDHFLAALGPTASGSEPSDDKWRISPADSDTRIVELTMPDRSSNTPLMSSILRQATPEAQFFAILPGSVIPFEEAEEQSDEQQKLVELISEQQQFESMGVWENDPPLRVSTKEAFLEPTLESELGRSSEIFGIDFEDEIDVPNNTAMSARQSHSSTHRFESHPKAELIEDIRHDYLHRMQQVADDVSSAAAIGNQPSDLPQFQLAPPSANSPTYDSSSHNGQLGESASCSDPKPGNWSIDVYSTNAAADVVYPNHFAGSATGPVARQPSIEDSIEEMVSQLNFSAFSVEPFSVEQIPIETPKRFSPPVDSLRRGSQDEIYMMHRPLSIDSKKEAHPSLDDDRDLLIIEEDIPLSNRVLDITTQDRSNPKTTDYSQLFSRLRK